MASNSGNRALVTKREYEKIKELYKQGLKNSQLASRFGVSRYTIGQYLKKEPSKFRKEREE